jgi:hypothetical protein
MKKQIWLQDHEWRYVAHAMSHIINHGVQGHGGIGSLELMRLREVILAAVRESAASQARK